MALAGTAPAETALGEMASVALAEAASLAPGAAASSALERKP